MQVNLSLRKSSVAFCTRRFILLGGCGNYFPLEESMAKATKKLVEAKKARKEYEQVSATTTGKKTGTGIPGCK